MMMTETNPNDPTAETQAHGKYEENRNIWRNLFEWPPTYLFERTRTLDQEQYDACCTFQRDYVLAGLSPKMSFDPMHLGGKGEMSDSAAEAAARWKAAYLSINGEHGKSIAVDMICHGFFAKQIIRADLHVLTGRTAVARYKTASALTARLVDACDDLVRYYQHPVPLAALDHLLSERDRLLKRRLLEAVSKSS